MIAYSKGFDNGKTYTNFIASEENTKSGNLLNELKNSSGNLKQSLMNKATE